jgi:hypothetical protein
MLVIPVAPKGGHRGIASLKPVHAKLLSPSLKNKQKTLTGLRTWLK